MAHTKTHCKRGHLYTVANTIWQKKPHGKKTRKCRTCANTLHRVGAKANEKARRAAVRKSRTAWKAEAERLRHALKGIAEYCSGDNNTIRAIDLLATIRNAADRALCSNPPLRTERK